ncbi:hypothetical protein L1887_48066 [Cichorium endivia]|nr:hypothetical protein L1887_48066 [Cichorium endivia]
MEELGIASLRRTEPTLEDAAAEKAAIHQEMAAEEDTYLRYKKLQQHLEFLNTMEEYVKDEQRNLKRELVRAQEEVKRIQSVPLVIGQFLEPIDQHTGIVGSTTGSNYVVRILSTIDRELLKASSSVALHRHSNALVDVLPPEADSSIAMLGQDEKPTETYADIGGMDIQKQEIREAVELPLVQFDLYRQIGIDPPRGVLLYGPPGTGKTMLIDAIATKRFDAQTGADREVQRILLELLNQMDGFDQGSNVKVIMATNRADTLDPALPEVDLEDYVGRPDKLSRRRDREYLPAAGLQAVRKNRYVIMPEDFEEAWKQIVKKPDDSKMEFYQ